MLSEFHCPAEDRTFGLNKNPGGIFDLGFWNTALLNNVSPVGLAESFGKLFKARSVVADELMVEHLARPAILFSENLFHDPLQQRHIAIDAHLKKFISQCSSTAPPA